MSLVHAPYSTPELEKAMKLGIPFARTTCGRTVARKELVMDAKQSTCPSCNSAPRPAQVEAKAAVEVPAKPQVLPVLPVSAVTTNESGEDLGLDGVDLEGTDPEESVVIEEPKKASDDGSQMLAMMLESVVEPGFQIPENWQATLDDERLSEADRKVLRELSSLASFIKADRLTARIVTIVAHLLDRSAVLKVEEASETTIEVVAAEIADKVVAVVTEVTDGATTEA
jgi:hypothetical protein